MHLSSSDRSAKTFADFHDEQNSIRRIAAEAMERAGGEHRPAAPYLEQSTNAVTEWGHWWEVKKKGCKSWFCAECCLAKGIKLKEKLKSRLGNFKGLMMLTLTIDQQLFAGPEDAFEYVTAHRCISVFIQRLHRAAHLHSRQYFCVVEWQENGWPHWHILVDSGRIPFADLCEAWNRNWKDWQERVKRGRPGFGSVRFSVPKFADQAKAAGYLTAYLTKVPKYGFPEWVLKRPSRSIRRYYTSKGFWGESSQQDAPECETEGCDTEVEPEAETDDACPVCHAEGAGYCDHCPECGWSVLDEAAVPADAAEPFPGLDDEAGGRQTIEAVLAECGQESVLISCREQVNRQTGELEVVRRFVKTLPALLAVVIAEHKPDVVNDRKTRATYRNAETAQGILNVFGDARSTDDDRYQAKLLRYSIDDSSQEWASTGLERPE